MLFKTNYNKKSSFLKELSEWFLTIIITVLVALFITSNIISTTQIKEQSMEPSFKENDKLIIYKLGYNFKGPKRGDVIILNKNITEKGIFINMINEGKDIIANIKYRFTGIIEKNNLIKRVIAIPGDKVDIRDGLVYVNGEVESGYEFQGMTYENSDLIYPYEIPNDSVFVLGDNRENSLDSRILGVVDYPQIKGKAVLRFWPFDRIGKIN
jgi:signal peptidase I